MLKYICFFYIFVGRGRYVVRLCLLNSDLFKFEEVKVLLLVILIVFVCENLERWSMEFMLCYIWKVSVIKMVVK